MKRTVRTRLKLCLVGAAALAFALSACTDASDQKTSENQTKPEAKASSPVALRGATQLAPSTETPKPAALRLRTNRPAPASEPTTAAIVTEPEPRPVSQNNPKNPESAEYSDLWAWNELWPGEWPDGFTVEWENVVLEGYSGPSNGGPADQDCPVRRGMTVHPWNADRIAKDEWKFKTATYRSKIVITKDAKILAASGAEDARLNFKVGDELRLEAVLSEGFIKASFQGKTYEFFDYDLRKVANFEQEKDPHLWVNITCNDKDQNRVWLRLKDVSGVEGIGPVNLTEYGQASDL